MLMYFFHPTCTQEDRERLTGRATVNTTSDYVIDTGQEAQVETCLSWEQKYTEDKTAPSRSMILPVYIIAALLHSKNKAIQKCGSSQFVNQFVYVLELLILLAALLCQPWSCLSASKAPGSVLQLMISIYIMS